MQPALVQFAVASWLHGVGVPVQTTNADQVQPGVARQVALVVSPEQGVEPLEQVPISARHRQLLAPRQVAFVVAVLHAAGVPVQLAAVDQV